MPVILDPGAFDLWLDPQVEEPDRLKPLLKPYPASKMTRIPISTRINSPKMDDPMLIEQVNLPEASRLTRSGGHSPDLLDNTN